MPPPKDNKEPRQTRSRGDSTTEPSLQRISDQIEENRNYMRKEFDKLHLDINSLTKRIAAVEKKQSEYEDTLTYQGDEILKLKQQLETLAQTQKQEDNSLKKQMTALQEAKNLKTLRISGIPKTANENLPDLVAELAKQMNCIMQKADIDSVYRVKPKDNQQTNMPIILRFTSMETRDSFYDGRKKLAQNSITSSSLIPTPRHGDAVSSKIFINEYLNRPTQQLFYEARKRRSELSYRYIWTFHNQIYMRKTASDDAIKVSSKDDLTDLE